MSQTLLNPPKAIRLVFELARADNPRLFDELSQFPKGSRRVNRLRVLANDGLLVQLGVLDAGGAPVRQRSSSFGIETSGAHVTDQLFEPGLKE